MSIVRRHDRAMITLWLIAFVFAGVLYIALRRAAAGTRLLVAAAPLVIALGMILWVMFIGDRMPEGAFVVQPAPTPTR